VVYLGDNLLPARPFGKHDERGEAILLQQLRATPAKKLPCRATTTGAIRGPTPPPWLREQQFVDGFRRARPGSARRRLPGPALETVVEAGAGLARWC
jgi:hypothetical protein